MLGEFYDRYDSINRDVDELVFSPMDIIGIITGTSFAEVSRTIDYNINDDYYTNIGVLRIIINYYCHSYYYENIERIISVRSMGNTIYLVLGNYKYD